MVDRQTVYFGQLARETDLLLAQQNEMVGLAKLAAGVLGATTIINGFTCTPTGPATLNVIVTAGEVYQLENLEATAWSALNPDTHTVLKQGLLLDPVVLGITPPSTVGFSQVYLIETQYQDIDTGATVLPYFNAANPPVPFSGPGNAGTAQNTVRKGVAAIQIKAGIAATTGTQVAPTPDAGWTAMFTVTVANGASTVTSGNITTLTSAPFIPVTLPNVPAGVRDGIWVFAQDTGTVNAYVGSVFPVPTTLKAGMAVRLKIANTNTGASTFNLNGLGTNPIVRGNLAALSANDLNASQVAELVFDGTNWQIKNYLGGGTGAVTNNFNTSSGLPYCADSSGTPNTITAIFSPVITSGQLVAGLAIEVKLANTVTGATAITVNTNASKNVVKPDGTAIISGDLVAGQVLLLFYDGTQFQVIGGNIDAVSPLKVIEMSGGGQSIVGTTITLLTCRTTVNRNTLSTSTWDGTTFTVGAGEDGLWSVRSFCDIGNQSNMAIYSLIKRTRSGVDYWFTVGFMTYGLGPTGVAEALAVAHGLIDLKVGDTIKFYIELQGSSGTFATIPVGNGTFNYPDQSLFRIEGLH